MVFHNFDKMRDIFIKILTILCISVLSVSISVAEGQNTRIRGNVTDEEGKPLEGVAVMEKGTSNGVLTDSEGKFLLKSDSENGTIVFSCLGYLTVEVAASDY